MANGSFTFVLHSHLPYVLAHGKWPHGTDWLNEAAAESYVPLLDTLNRLVAEGVSPKLTLGITPVLAEMLASDAFREEFRGYLQDKVQRAGEDHDQFLAQGEKYLAELALFWRRHFQATLEAFEGRYRRDLVGAFRALQDGGHIEIMTSAATHGYLPLLGTDDGPLPRGPWAGSRRRRPGPRSWRRGRLQRRRIGCARVSPPPG